MNTVPIFWTYLLDFLDSFLLPGIFQLSLKEVDLMAKGDHSAVNIPARPPCLNIAVLTLSAVSFNICSISVSYCSAMSCRSSSLSSFLLFK